jgi:hypothetical protein
VEERENLRVTIVRDWSSCPYYPLGLLPDKEIWMEEIRMEMPLYFQNRWELLYHKRLNRLQMSKDNGIDHIIVPLFSY